VLIGRRYKPALAVLSTGNGAFTMGPEDAASAVQLLGVSHTIPVHYAHNPLVIGTHCAEYFRDGVARVAPHTVVTVLTPGKTTTTLTLPGVTPRSAPRRRCEVSPRSSTVVTFFAQHRLV
jgi:L-ascorbate metabolism protein UlaG (beta-lactamase superfamily)